MRILTIAMIILSATTTHALAPSSRIQDPMFDCEVAERCYPDTMIQEFQAWKEGVFARAAKQSNRIVICCSYCKKYLGHKDPQGAKPGLSHGICDRCAEIQLAELRRWRMERNSISAEWRVFDEVEGCV